jgi:hypothetical protein
MNRWRVGEDRGSKEMDGCPLTVQPREIQSKYITEGRYNVQHLHSQGRTL